MYIKRVTKLAFHMLTWLTICGINNKSKLWTIISLKS